MSPTHRTAPATPDAEPEVGLAPLASRRDALLTWFAGRARPFPWRERRTPYRVWVSEVMLQQTRAATVVPYFERWMERFPNVRALAAATEEEVLAAWEGLGYYRRARALHRAAKDAVARGGLPRDEAAWRALPGVGPYTAAAVAALALGRPAVAVDGNVRRVGARLAADPTPRDEALRSALAPLLPGRDPGRASEALIELGATVCRPRAPDCPDCPLRPACAAARTGDPARWPAPRRRGPAPERRRYGVVRLRGDAVWLERRPADGLLGGLWGFPQRPDAPTGRALPAVRHAYSHFTLDLVPVVAPDARPGSDGEGRWASPADLEALPLSRVDRVVVARLREAGLLASAP